jgi:broad specificity phosphatase PhoE
MQDWYFVRHCESEANRQRMLAGQLDSRLSWRGSLQCVALTSLALRLKADRVICSDLQRATITARFVRFGSGCDFVVTARLRERCAGLLEGSSLKALRQNAVMDNLRTWCFRPSGGESRRDVALRALDWLRALPDRDTTIMVSHQIVISALVGLLDSCSPVDQVHGGLRNGKYFRRAIPSDTWKKLYHDLVAGDTHFCKESRSQPTDKFQV